MTAISQTYENHLDQQDAKWFAVYTKYKREKLVVKTLQEKGIHAYVPIQKVTRHYTRKINRVELPLINCYIFTKITKPEYVPVLETQDVIQFVKFSKNLIAIPEREIDLMKRITGENIALEVDQNTNYQVGDEVEIIAGNLTGLRGKLLRTGKKNFLVNLQNIGFSLRMEINPKFLQKINAKAYYNY